VHVPFICPNDFVMKRTLFICKISMNPCTFRDCVGVSTPAMVPRRCGEVSRSPISSSVTCSRLEQECNNVHFHPRNLCRKPGNPLKAIRRLSVSISMGRVVW
jgi:hypothetical protein